ncbi:MAG: hypothetical protein ISS80_05315 [Candidatus Cloacimonetes bacterium]|nr:hypothetical protein [Candidatus Cloacimonadota bacterium]
MKKIIIITALTLLLFSMANAQTQSFRSIALGTIIDDDLDLVYDPIELKFVEGSRLYTNLSNLTSSNENVFDNVTDDTYLIGFSTKNPFIENLWNAVLIKFENSKTSNYVSIDSDLNGWDDIDGYGTLIDEYTAYEDNTGDDIYDILTTISQEVSDFSETNYFNFVLNNTYDLGSMVLGARIDFSKSCDDDYTDYSLDYTYHLIEDNYDDITIDGLEDFNNTNEFSTFDFLGSVFLPDVNGYEIRGDINFQNRNTSWGIDDSEELRIDDLDPEIVDYEDYEIEQATFNSTLEEKGNSFAVGGSIRKTFNQASQRKNDGYWRFGAGINFGSFDYKDSEEDINTYIEKFLDPEDSLNIDYIETITEKEESADDGTNKILGFDISFKLNYPLDEKVYFGIGGHLDHNTANRETDYIESIENIEDFEILDEEATASDYTITETYGYTADRTFEHSQTILSLPVGIEYKFTNNNKWAGRFGAIFRNVFTTINDAKQITNAEPFITETVLGDGTTDVVIEDNIYESTSEHTNSAYSDTDFYYGIGFQPTDKMQIDLLGYFGSAGNSLLDADFYRNLRLSFTLKF